MALSGPGYAIQVVNGEVLYGDFDVGLLSFNPVAAPVPSLRVAQSGIRKFLFDTENDSIVFTVAEPGSVKRYFPNTMQVEDLTSPTEAWDIVQDDGYYYFSDKGDGTLRRIAKPAVGNEPTEPMASGLSGARGLALDDDFVYVVSGTAVTRVAKAPPFANTVVAAAAAGNQLAIDEQFIYWTNFGSGTLMKIAKPL